MLAHGCAPPPCPRPQGGRRPEDTGRQWTCPKERDRCPARGQAGPPGPLAGCVAVSARPNVPSSHHLTPPSGDWSLAPREGRAVHTRVWTVAPLHRLSASLCLWPCVLATPTRGDPKAGGAAGRWASRRRLQGRGCGGHRPPSVAPLSSAGRPGDRPDGLLAGGRVLPSEAGGHSVVQEVGASNPTRSLLGTRDFEVSLGRGRGAAAPGEHGLAPLSGPVPSLLGTTPGLGAMCGQHPSRRRGR